MDQGLCALTTTSRMGDRGGVQVDRQEMGVLSEDECSTLLDSARLGRLALTDGALPMIVPLGFARLDGDLIFRVGSGVVQRAAEMNQVVCFETDWVDAAYRAAWSVSAIGVLSMLRHVDRQRADQLDLVQWSSSSATYVQLTPQLVSGRRRFE
jgi:nitroimidazol reductase NimA-like FMN-containing flavoprotein (pyridoxamine 5'-phosphate oxidase superfamily)